MALIAVEKLQNLK